MAPEKAVGGNDFSSPEKAVDGRNIPEKAMDGNDFPSEKAMDGNDMAEKHLDPEKATRNAISGNNKKHHETRKRLFRDTTNQLEIEERLIDIKKKKKQIRQGVIDENVCGMCDRGFSISEDKDSGLRFLPTLVSQYMCKSNHTKEMEVLISLILVAILFELYC